jgi:hypothetical protein
VSEVDDSSPGALPHEDAASVRLTFLFVNSTSLGGEPDHRLTGQPNQALPKSEKMINSGDYENRFPVFRDDVDPLGSV